MTFKQDVLHSDQLVQVALQSNKTLKSLEIIGNVPENLAQAISVHGEQVEHVDVSQMNKKIEFEALMYLTELKNLNSIKISPYQSPVESQHIQSLALNCKKLEVAEFPLISSISNQSLEKFCQELKHCLRKLSLVIFGFGNWNFSSFGLMEKLTVLNVHLSCHSPDIFTNEQMSNLGKIPNLLEFSLKGGWHPDHVYLPQQFERLFSKIKLQNLIAFTLEIQCALDLGKTHMAILENVGAKLQKSRLPCFYGEHCSIFCKKAKE